MQLLIIVLFAFIKSTVSEPQQDLSVNKRSPVKPLTKKTEDSTSSSSEEDGILIKISENKKKKTNTNKASSKSEKKKERKPQATLKKPKVTTAPTLFNNAPFDFDSKKVKPQVKKASAPVPLDSTYKTPTSDFLLKDFASKSVKVTFTEQEIKDFEAFSKNLDSFLPSINRVNLVVKNILKNTKKEEKSSKPSELFNIKVIEVSDGTTPN